MKKIIPFLVMMSIGFLCFADWVDHPIGFNVWIPEIGTRKQVIIC